MEHETGTLKITIRGTEHIYRTTNPWAVGALRVVLGLAYIAMLPVVLLLILVSAFVAALVGDPL